MPHARWPSRSKAVGRLCATASARSGSQPQLRHRFSSSSAASVFGTAAETPPFTETQERWSVRLGIFLRAGGRSSTMGTVQDDLEAFLAQPLVAHVAASGPTVRPVWFLWEEGCFWWLTGPWSALAQRLDDDPRVALVVDTCDLSTGRVLQVTVSGAADVVALNRDRAVRKLSRYLGADLLAWPARFRDPLDDPDTRMVRLRPKKSPVLKDLSFPLS
jgi:hypothetical protein